MNRRHAEIAVDVVGATLAGVAVGLAAELLAELVRRARARAEDDAYALAGAIAAPELDRLETALLHEREIANQCVRQAQRYYDRMRFAQLNVDRAFYLRDKALARIVELEDAAVPDEPVSPDQ